MDGREGAESHPYRVQAPLYPGGASRDALQPDAAGGSDPGRLRSRLRAGN